MIIMLRDENTASRDVELKTRGKTVHTVSDFKKRQEIYNM